MSDKPRVHACCWNCPALIKGGGRFVETFGCRHPKVQAAMARKGVKYLNKEKLDQECPLFVRDIKAINSRDKREPQHEQLSLL